MSLEERLEQAEKLVADVKAELAAMRATKPRNWPERIEAGDCFGIEEAGVICKYIVSDQSRLVCIASNTPRMIGGKWNSESLFHGAEERFTYLGHARDILAILTDAHEPTGAELVGRSVEYFDMDGLMRGRGECVGYDHESANPYKITGGRGWFNSARLAKWPA